MHRVDAMPAAGNRPAAGAGTNYVLVGSDSRAGLTKAQRKALATGTAVGQRTDSIMLVHLPAGGGEPTLVSLPRDSYVPIPGHGSNKINASYSIGGPKLLIDTIEQVSGLHVDGYVEIGFGGFASVVDSLGGVEHVPEEADEGPQGRDQPQGRLPGPGRQERPGLRPRPLLRPARRLRPGRSGSGSSSAPCWPRPPPPVNVLLPWRLHSIATAGGNALTVGQDESADRGGQGDAGHPRHRQGQGQPR